MGGGLARVLEIRSGTLCERRIAHAKASAHVFRKPLDGWTINDRIGLGQILHSFDQQALAVDVSGIGGTFSTPASQFGRDWNRKNFSHEINPKL
jgi:hypothetical protein